MRILLVEDDNRIASDVAHALTAAGYVIQRALVETRFKAADVDNEGTLNAKELHSKAGKALLKLLK